MSIETKTAKNRSKSIAVLTGVLFYFIPVLFNQWTLKFFFADYIGDALASHVIMLLWLLAACSIGLGWGVIKYGFCIFREIGIIFLLFIPVYFTVPYIVFSVSNATNVPDLLYGQMLCILICTALTLIFFRWGMLLGFLFLSLVSFIELMYGFMYRTLINSTAFFNIFETNFQEARGYLASYFFNFISLIFIVISAIVCLLIFKGIERVNRKRMKLYLIVLSGVLSLPLALPQGRKSGLSNNLLFKATKGLHEYKVLYAKVDEFSNKPLDEIEPISFSQPRPDKELHVFIIGESADRDHMGVYGYNRNNTPMMEEMSEELFLFSDVISVHFNTIPNMEKMLTFANYENDEDNFEKGSLIHYLRKAGYETHWISNQEPMGINDTMTTVLAKTCDSVRFVNDLENFSHKSLDGKILPVFAEVISQDVNRSQFLFIHLIGSHVPFDWRYPREYDRFKGNIDGKSEKQSEMINRYDNSILYNDYIVTEIIKMVKETDRNASVLYISDHGLEVCDQSDYCGQSLYEGLEVPMVLWVSDEYKKTNSRKVENFNRYIDRKYSSDDIIFSICDLLNMRFDSFEPNRSIFCDSFMSKIRYVGLPNKSAIWNYDSGSEGVDEKSKLVFKGQSEDFKHKVWAHTINNTDKLVSASEIFYGMELDVVFDLRKKIFDVRHPPAKTNNLSLDEHWGRLDDAGRFKFWIDYKNLSPENRTASLERLLYLADKHHIPHENIMVESRVSFPLRDFKAKGFITSYWISVAFLQEDVAKSFDELGKNKQLALMKIKRELEEYGIDAISFPIESLDQVNKFLPEVDVVNLWAPKMVFDRPKDLAEVGRILEANPRINAFLVNFSY